MNRPTPDTTGLSGDLGWPDADHRSFGLLGGALLVIASSVYWALIWVLSGLAPLPFVGRRHEPARARQRAAAAHRRPHDTTWSSNNE